MTLDSFLNFAVPIAIFAFLIAIIYGKAKKPIDNFFRTVKGWFKGDDDGGGESYSESDVWEHKIRYRGGD